MQRVNRRTYTLVASALFVAACDHSSKPLYFPPRGLREASFEQIDRRPELSSYAKDVGRELYEMKTSDVTGCMGCHGLGVGPDLFKDQLIWGDDPDSIYSSIKYGVRVVGADGSYAETKGVVEGRVPDSMPSFTKTLSEDEIWCLTRFVVGLTLSKNPVSSSDDAIGRSLYATHCAVCHGNEAEGRPRMGYRALVGVRDVERVRSAIQNGKWLPGMPRFNDNCEDWQLKCIAYYLFDARRQ